MDGIRTSVAGDEILDPVDVAVIIAAILDGLDIPYVLGGSLASSLLGEPRATNDVDIAVDMTDASAESLIDAFAADFYLDAAVVLDAVHRRDSFNLIHLPTVMKADIFVLGDGLLDRRQIERRRRVLVVDSGVELWIGSAEDQVLRKLSWFRKGGEVSDRQLRDVVGLLSVQAGRLDREDLETAAQALGLADLLARVYRGTDPETP